MALAIKDSLELWVLQEPWVNDLSGVLRIWENQGLKMKYMEPMSFLPHCKNGNISLH